MTFCSQCGNQVGAAPYCAQCGSKQPVDDAAPPSTAAVRDALAAVNPRTASILCYIPGIGWIGSIIVLASGRFRQDRLVRFPGFHLHAIIQAVLLGMSIFMMVKAAHDEAYPLPIFGELAQKSVAED